MSFLIDLRKILIIFHNIGRFPFAFNKNSNQFISSIWSIIYTIFFQLIHYSLALYLTVYFYDEFLAVNFGAINMIRKISISINFSSIWLNYGLIFIFMIKNCQIEMKLFNDVIIEMKFISKQKQNKLITNLCVMVIMVGFYFIIGSISFNFWNKELNVKHSIIYGIIQESARTSLMIQTVYYRFMCECILNEIDQHIFGRRSI